MDAENDNDQPNSSSTSASSSSSNNSSSSNLVGHLPMLPFMRSTDDDEIEADELDGNANDNDMNEEPMPLQPPVTMAMAMAMATASAAQPASASVQQPTIAPITTTATATGAGTSTASSSVDSEEPMVGAEQLAVLASSSASSLPPPSPLIASPLSNLSLTLQPPPLSTILHSSLTSYSSVCVPPSTFLAPANPSQVNVPPFLFDIPNFTTSNASDFSKPYQLTHTPYSPSPTPLTSALSPPLLPPTSQSFQHLVTLMNGNSTPSLTSSSLSSSASSSSSLIHQIHYNTTQSQLSLFHKQYPIPTCSFSISSQQQQLHIASPTPQTSTIESTTVPLSSISLLQQEEQQLAAQINNNDIVDTIDASAVIVRPLEANAEVGHEPHLYPQEAAIAETEQQNDTQLDDNDLNARNDDALATTSASSSQQPQQLQQTESITLNTSDSGSAGPSSSGQQQTPQPPTSLPLLPQQQQQTEEFKRLPSLYHHYHNPSEYHLHAHPYQHPCVYPYGFRSTSTSQNNTNGVDNSNTSSNNNIIFGNSMSSDKRKRGKSAAGLSGVDNTSSPQVVDRLKLLYPNVNENETPLPRCWSPHDKCLSIGLSQNNLRVHFKGVGKQSNDAASVRTAHPIPPACGIYYFEVKIISKGKNGYMGIGLTAQQFRMNRLPGWDKQSYGYHGDDGNSFSSSGHGQSYGPTFTTGDIIGCCVNFVNNTCFYTKNGIDLGIAFRDLPNKLYPTVGLQTPGEEVDANFGQEPFKFDQIEDMMKQMRAELKATIYDFPLPAEQGDPTTLLQKMISSYLVHNGYSQTAEVFSRQKTTDQNLREDISSIRNRQKILKLVMSGKMGQAIEQTIRLYPGLLENNKNLWFMLKCRQFIEMINGSDIEYCPTSSMSTTNKILTNSITTQTPAAPNQTSVIQSTKSYQNGNGPNNNSSNGSLTTDPIVAITIDTTPTTTTTTTTTTTNIANGSSNTANNATENIANATTTINNAQNSSHITVIHTDDNIKTKTNLVEHCSTSKDAPTSISKCSNDDDYLNDVEMENNGHTTNGDVYKNGNTNSCNESTDTDEEMDVDIPPTVKKYSPGIERILEFGKDLSQMGQQLDKENKMTDEERQMLEDAFSLIAYSNPWASPLGWQLCPTKRETVCRALNSAILESMNYPKWPPLEYCVAHANELLKVMAQASLGTCAFINIADVFPKN